MSLPASLIDASAAHAQRPERGEAELARMLAGRVPGKPVDCIDLRSAGSSHVIDRTAIVYGSGGTLYVNRPRSGASSLDSDDIQVTRTSGSQLCSLDTVRLVDRGSRIPSGFIALDKFVPYARPRNRR
ncbi:MAG: hypothetical protein JF608_14510 [Sphingomonadales bacterium]|nr:hypothetical protein [Sphingomonadales bacterium]